LRHEALIEAVLRVVKFVEVTEKVKVVVEHSADDKFIECALAVGPTVLLVEISSCLEWAVTRRYE
jgi:hypothetical protein